MNRGVLILAGGKGSRMGYCEKGELLYDGSTFLERIIKNFENENIYISTKERYKNNRDVEYIYDESEEYTPLEAITNFFEKTDIDVAFILACDMPFTVENIFLKMLDRLENYSGIICYDEEKFLYPLGAVYTRKLLPKLREQREKKNYKLKDIFNGEDILKISMSELDVSEKNFININTPQDYEKYIKRGQNEKEYRDRGSL